MKLAILNVFFILILKNMKIDAKKYQIYTDINLNETEWQIKMVKSYKALDQSLCVLDCSRVPNCALISFNKFNNNCKYYSDYLSNATKLLESNGNFIFNINFKIFH